MFVTQPETTILLEYKDKLIYRLPETQDPEGNADAQILIEPFQDYEDLYPPFINIYNGNRTFDFNVNKKKWAGGQYFFKVVLKEVGVNAIGFPYYFQVFVAPIGGDNSEID